MIDTAVTRTTYYQVIDTPQLTSTTSPSAKERPAAQATQAAAEGARGAAEAGEEEEARAEALQRTQRSREAEERSDLGSARFSGKQKGKQRVPSTLRFRKFPGKTEGVWCSILEARCFP